MISRKKLSGSTFVATVAIILSVFGFAFTQDQPWDPNVSPLPTPTGFVNDYAGVIDAGTKQQLETKLKQFKQKTTVEIAVAVVRTTGGRDIFDYSLAVARGWKIGSDQADNPGALLFVAIDDRKYFTQISRDLEDELPDALAGNLQRQYLVPEFKKGNYSKGISDTIDAYVQKINQRLSGIPEPTTVSGERSNGGFPTFSLFCCLVIILIIVLIILANRGGGGKSQKDNDRWGGGFGGGGGALPWIIGSAIGSSGSSGSSWGGSNNWGGGSSGGWGGFGGGGDFGGGGSGGGW